MEIVADQPIDTPTGERDIFCAVGRREGGGKGGREDK